MQRSTFSAEYRILRYVHLPGYFGMRGLVFHLDSAMSRYALSLGARYYMGGFFLGGSLGVGHDSGKLNLQDGQSLDGGSAYGFFKSAGAGYQLPLRNGDVLEAEAGIFGTKAMKVGGTVRYKFRR